MSGVNRYSVIRRVAKQDLTGKVESDLADQLSNANTAQEIENILEYAYQAALSDPATPEAMNYAYNKKLALAYDPDVENDAEIAEYQEEQQEQRAKANRKQLFEIGVAVIAFEERGPIGDAIKKAIDKVDPELGKKIDSGSDFDSAESPEMEPENIPEADELPFESVDDPQPEADESPEPKPQPQVDLEGELTNQYESEGSKTDELDSQEQYLGNDDPRAIMDANEAAGATDVDKIQTTGIAADGQDATPTGQFAGDNVDAESTAGQKDTAVGDPNAVAGSNAADPASGFESVEENAAIQAAQPSSDSSPTPSPNATTAAPDVVDAPGTPQPSSRVTSEEEASGMGDKRQSYGLSPDGAEDEYANSPFKPPEPPKG